jgi:glycosyltransferase involved in cell wall biosynthesis
MIEVRPVKKYIFLTNIPTPYRSSLYNALARQGFNFEVFYMRATEGDRSWSIDPSDMQHRHYIDEGVYAMFGRYHLHFNPRLLSKLLRERDADIIVGGGWNDLDVLALVTLKRLGILRNQLHFWTEANYLTIGARRDNLLKRLVRRYVYNSSSGAQLSSGRMTELTLERWGITGKPFVPLPNTIDEERFTISDADVERRYANHTPTFLLPARLTEKVKGIINFFRSIGDENTRRARFLVAGDGPDEDAIRKFIEERQLGAQIELLGFCNAERMVELYKCAHVVVLPSFSDASPLALIEALKMRLPLLVSARCGNHFEVLAPGENGYLFDPSAAETVKDAFEHLMRRRADWPAMGEISGDRYRTSFERSLVIENFVRGLAELAAKEPTAPSHVAVHAA